MAVEPIFESYGNKLIGVPNNEESGGSGGHVIENSSGTDLPQEDTLQFADSHVTDDSGNDRTVVETFKAVTEAEYSSETEDGAYIITDGDGAVIGPASEDYVEVEQAVGGTKTWGELIGELNSLADYSKINGHSFIVLDDMYFFSITIKGNNYCYFNTNYIDSSTGQCSNIIMRPSGGYTERTFAGVFTSHSNEVPNEGEKLTLYYGNRKATVDLQTTANRCVTSDGGTVQSNLNRLNYSPLIHTGLTYTNCTYSDGGYSVIGNVVIVNIRVKVTDTGNIEIDGFPRPKSINSKTPVGVNVFRIQQDKASQLYAYMSLSSQQVTNSTIKSVDVSLTANEEYSFSAVYVSDYAS